MSNEYTTDERLAMLFELGLAYHSEFKKAVADDDTEKALHLHDLTKCVRTLIKDIEERE